MPVPIRVDGHARLVFGDDVTAFVLDVTSIPSFAMMKLRGNVDSLIGESVAHLANRQFPLGRGGTGGRRAVFGGGHRPGAGVLGSKTVGGAVPVLSPVVACGTVAGAKKGRDRTPIGPWARG